ncbi:MAG: hypothetical protein AB4206_05195 [Xenococcaceae cyanobacterium]
MISNFIEPRGADNQAEFDRQLDKLVTTLATLEHQFINPKSLGK